MPAEINAISQLTLLPDAHCRASARLGPPVVAVLDQWSPEHVLGVLVLLPYRGPLWYSQGKSSAFGNAASGREVLQGRRSCSSVNSSVTPFPLLLTTGIFFPAWNCLALTWSHWISFRELVRVMGVSRGNTSGHKYFLLICKHQPLVM